jgi:hypothetical protein
MRRLLPVMLILGLTVPALAQAHAPKGLVPPGDSAASQYLETVPTAAGAKKDEPSAGSHAALPPGEVTRLEHSGTSGRLLLSVVAATAPEVVVSRDREHRRTTPKGIARVGTSRGSPRESNRGAGNDVTPALSDAGASPSPAAAVVGAATGRDAGGSLGLLLPAALALVAVGVLAAVLRRRGARDA